MNSRTSLALHDPNQFRSATLTTWNYHFQGLTGSICKGGSIKQSSILNSNRSGPTSSVGIVPLGGYRFIVAYMVYQVPRTRHVGEIHQGSIASFRANRLWEPVESVVTPQVDFYHGLVSRVLWEIVIVGGWTTWEFFNRLFCYRTQRSDSPGCKN